MTSALHLRLRNYADKRPLRYLVAGGFNTAFGYLVSVGLYYSLRSRFDIITIGILINIVCITEAFVVYKALVFKSHGHWLGEYLRAYVVYGGSAVLGVLGLWLLVGVIRIPFWIAQAALIVVSVGISYLGHKKFTFGAGPADDE